MSIDTLLTRYELTARAEGLSPKTIDHIKLAIRLFANSIGGIQDVRKATPADSEFAYQAKKVAFREYV